MRLGPSLLRLPLTLFGVAGASACASWSSSVTTTPATLAADSAVREALAAEASLDPASFPPGSVGVLPLQVASTDPELEPLGYGLAMLLMTDLARSGQVQVVDRLRVDALLRELSLAESGVVDPASAPRAGRILGARHLVLGTVSGDRSAEIRVDARLARTEDATVRPVVSGTASLDDVLEAEKTLAFRVFDALGVNLTPAERAAVERRPTRNLAALLAFGRGVRAEAELRLYEAVREYREAARLDPSFQQAREREAALELYVPDPFAVASISIDRINRPAPRGTSDIAEPAFQGGTTAVLVIPIIVH